MKDPNEPRTPGTPTTSEKVAEVSTTEQMTILSLFTLMGNIHQQLNSITARLERMELTLRVNTGNQKKWYTTEELAILVGKNEFTVREWCRLGRVNAKKKASGRGSHTAWAISHEELERIRSEGLLPKK